MKQFTGFFLALVLALGLTGCWGKKDPAPKPTPTPRPSSSQSSSMPSQSGPLQESAPSQAPSKPETSSEAAATAAAPRFSEGNWALVLVNKDHPLPPDFAPRTQNVKGYDKRPFDERALPQLEAMLTAAEKDGCPLYLVSGYRSIQRQKALFERRTRSYATGDLTQEQAEAEAEKLVARPGCSEHNSGLAADIVSADWYRSHSDLTEDFEGTDAFRWLDAHAAEYGFILRYPKGKEAVTGVSYEPWHYRYVGKDAAREMKEKGLVLEEYLNA